MPCTARRVGQSADSGGEGPAWSPPSLLCDTVLRLPAGRGVTCSHTPTSVGVHTSPEMGQRWLLPLGSRSCLTVLQTSSEVVGPRTTLQGEKSLLCSGENAHSHLCSHFYLIKFSHHYKNKASSSVEVAPCPPSPHATPLPPHAEETISYSLLSTLSKLIFFYMMILTHLFPGKI